MAWITANIVKRGGTCKYNTIYYNTSDYYHGWYSDTSDQTSRVLSMTVSRPGCTFLGGTTKSDGSGYLVIRPSGIVNEIGSDVSSPCNIYLQWEGCPCATMSLTNLSGGSSIIIYDHS